MPPFDCGMRMCDALDLQVERRVVEESSSVHRDRSHLLRNRLCQASCESPVDRALECLHSCRGGYSALSIPWRGCGGAHAPSTVSCPMWVRCSCCADRKPMQAPLFQEVPKEKGLSFRHIYVLKESFIWTYRLVELFIVNVNYFLLISNCPS